MKSWGGTGWPGRRLVGATFALILVLGLPTDLLAAPTVFGPHPSGPAGGALAAIETGDQVGKGDGRDFTGDFTADRAVANHIYWGASSINVTIGASSVDLTEVSCGAGSRIVLPSCAIIVVPPSVV